LDKYPVSRRTLWVIFCLFIVYGGMIPFNFARDLHVVSQHVGRRLEPAVSPETGRRTRFRTSFECLSFPAFGARSACRGASCGSRSAESVTLGAPPAFSWFQLFTLIA
jgi:hypothetical protein